MMQQTNTAPRTQLGRVLFPTTQPRKLRANTQAICCRAQQDHSNGSQTIKSLADAAVKGLAAAALTLGLSTASASAAEDYYYRIPQYEPPPAAAPRKPPPPAPASSGSSHWNYRANGADWSGACKEGHEQSPMPVWTNGKMVHAKIPQGIASEVHFGKGKNARVINTGHSLQVEWDAVAGTGTSYITVAGESVLGTLQDYVKLSELQRVPLVPLQFHFHATSEHIVDGKMAPMEMHLVTKVDPTSPNAPSSCRTGTCLAVFGVLMQFNPDDPWEPNPFLQMVLDNIPSAVGKEASTRIPGDKAIDLMQLLPADKTYVTYGGSLTTPPCTEGVFWHVFTQPLYVSIDQVNSFEAAMANVVVQDKVKLLADPQPYEAQYPTGARTNNRTLQQINGRLEWVAVAS